MELLKKKWKNVLEIGKKKFGYSKVSHATSCRKRCPEIWKLDLCWSISLWPFQFYHHQNMHGNDICVEGKHVWGGRQNFWIHVLRSSNAHVLSKRQRGTWLSRNGIKINHQALPSVPCANKHLTVREIKALQSYILYAILRTITEKNVLSIPLGLQFTIMKFATIKFGAMMMLQDSDM